MMTLTSRRGRIPTKHLTIEATSHHSDEDVLRFAMETERETRSSLFGWSVNRDPDDPSIVYVQLHTD